LKKIDNIELIIPLWELYDLESLDEVIFNVKSSDYLKNGYNLDERKNMYESLKWAELNSDFQFESIMKFISI